MLASWIVATHYRPHLLRAALECINASVLPAGWRQEIIVAHHENDAVGAVIAAELHALPITTKQPTGGGKRNAALRAATGDLVLVADDDDCHSPARLSAAVAAHAAGNAISEVREFRYLHLATGYVVRWCGRGTPTRPGVVVGTARNFRRSLLTRVGGWKALPRLIEKDLQSRIAGRLPRNARAADLSDALADSTICVQHAANIWDDRPALARGQEIWRGDFRLVGEGHWSELPTFPLAVAARLGLT